MKRVTVQPLADGPAGPRIKQVARDNVIAIAASVGALKPRKVYGEALPFSPVYRSGMTNVCPCCGGSSWWIGRTSAECSDCGSPLPLVHATKIGKFL